MPQYASALVTHDGLLILWVTSWEPSAYPWPWPQPPTAKGKGEHSISNQADIFHPKWLFAAASCGWITAKLADSLMVIHKGLLGLAPFCSRSCPAWGGSQGNSLPGDKTQWMGTPHCWQTSQDHTVWSQASRPSQRVTRGWHMALSLPRGTNGAEWQGDRLVWGREWGLWADLWELLPLLTHVLTFQELGSLSCSVSPSSEHSLLPCRQE